MRPRSYSGGCVRTVSSLGIASVFAADFEEGLGDLAEAAVAGGVEEFGKDVVAVAAGVLQALESVFSGVCMFGVEGADVFDLSCFFVFGAATEFHFGHHGEGVSVGIHEGVYPDNGVVATGLEVFVVVGVFLDASALVAAFHGTEDAAPF